MSFWQKRNVTIGILFVLLLGLSSTALAYTPLPGVLGPEDVDLQGATVTLISHRDQVGTIEGMNPGRTDEAKKLFNVGAFEAISSTRPEVAADITARVLAGDSTHDLIFFDDRSGYWSLVAGGVIHPLDDLLPPEYYASLWPMCAASHEGARYQGQIYSFGLVRGPFNTVVITSTYNKSLLEREGQPDIFELYQEKEWNWDMATQIARGVTRDTTGDGEVDQFGMPDPTSDTEAFIFAVANGGAIFQEIDGRYTFTFNQPPAIEALNQLHEWRTVDNVVAPESGSARYPLWMEGKVAMTHNNHTGSFRDPVSQMEDEWTVVPTPMGPRATEYIYASHMNLMNMIPINAADPAGLIAVHEFLFQSEADYDEAEIWAAHTANRLPDRNSVEVMRAAHRDSRGEAPMVRGTPMHDILNQGLASIWAGELGPAAAMDGIADSFQAALDDIFGQ